jgi:hypothetical protein
MKNKIIKTLLLTLALDLGAFAQDNIEGNFYFSNNPFGATSAGGTTNKKIFSSSEFLYGRIELKEDKKLSDVFSFIEDDKESGGKSFVQYSLAIYKDGNLVSQPKTGYWSYCLLNNEDRDKTYFNFDILPAPGKATTLMASQKNFSSGKSCSPLYSQIVGDQISNDGVYTITIKLFKTAYNAYGKALSYNNQISTTLEFDFKSKDIPLLLKNHKLVDKEVTENAFAYKELPAIFKNSQAIPDANLTVAKIRSYLSRSYSGWTILKVATSREGYTGPIWTIAKNNDGTIRIRSARVTICIAYKDKEDNKCYVRYMEVRQDYMGGGQFGELFIRTAGDEKRSIACSAIK